MSDYIEPVQDEESGTIACEVCLKEIPLSEAKSEEASDYVFHFCGIDCYTKWKQQQRETGNSD